MLLDRGVAFGRSSLRHVLVLGVFVVEFVPWNTRLSPADPLYANDIPNPQHLPRLIVQLDRQRLRGRGCLGPLSHWTLLHGCLLLHRLVIHLIRHWLRHLRLMIHMRL
jgi:hypothetical protein